MRIYALYYRYIKPQDPGDLTLVSTPPALESEALDSPVPKRRKRVPVASTSGALDANKKQHVEEDDEVEILGMNLNPDGKNDDKNDKKNDKKPRKPLEEARRRTRGSA